MAGSGSGNLEPGSRDLHRSASQAGPDRGVVRISIDSSNRETGELSAAEIEAALVRVAHELETEGAPLNASDILSLWRGARKLNCRGKGSSFLLEGPTGSLSPESSREFCRRISRELGNEVILTGLEGNDHTTALELWRGGLPVNP